jgi:ketosteroid isomerase-like protein
MKATLFACLAAFAAPAFAQSPPAAPPDEWFIKTMQARVDAVALGDTKVWRDTLAPEGLFVDEEDNVSTTPELLAQLKPLPPGFSGHIEVTNPKIIRSGDAVVVTADLLETEFVFGQELHTKYRETDVWRPYADGWRIFASHSSVLPSEAKPVGKPAPLKDFAGEYRLAEGQTMTLTVKDNTLWMKRGDAAPEALIPLGGDHFARKGRNRGERIFVRDAKGKVTGFWDRRDNNDLRWTKVT